VLDALSEHALEMPLHQQRYVINPVSVAALLVYRSRSRLGPGTRAAAILVVAVVVLRARARARAVALPLAAVVGGAAGNLADRLFRGPGLGQGAVVEWIYVAAYPATFNLADVAIRLGAVASSSPCLYLVIERTL
jgi:lipoprotein signal peptidase